ncbi:MAG: hypothetical protein AAGE80_08260 [Pseudomonadota bacterium]
MTLFTYTVGVSEIIGQNIKFQVAGFGCPQGRPSIAHGFKARARASAVLIGIPAKLIWRRENARQ